MFTPWRWGRTSQATAVANARAAATELGRRRVERAEVELYLATRPGPRRAAGYPPDTGGGRRAVAGG